MSKIEMIKDFATQLHKCEYRKELTPNQREFATSNGLVVVYGASDDLTIFDGCISDEIGNGELFFNKDGEFFDEEDLTSIQKEGLNQIDTDYYPFRCATTIPHSSFEVLKDGDLYGYGIVFHVDDIK